MKKLLILAAVIVAGVAANAASFKWSGANIYGPDGNKFAGTAELFCDALSSSALTSTAVNNGALVAKTFELAISDEALAAETAYDFYFTITTDYNGKEVTFTSGNINVVASATGTKGIAFGNMASATQNASNWAAVPEPTSGLLMLLGIAGLALKRKRA